MPCKLMTPAERVKHIEKAEGRKLSATDQAAILSSTTPTFHCTPGKGIQGLGKTRRRGKK
jgi:hypothetical protein